jgi:ferritin
MPIKPVHDAINDQINAELNASYTYLAMSAYCELQHFPGCAKWLRLQSQEEYGHAMKLFDFLLARQGTITLKAMPEPMTSHFKSVVEVFEKALEQEQEVSQQIDTLYELAFKEKAFAAVELQWFLTEQVEEEKTARDIVARFHLVRNDPAAQLDLDRELGTRSSAE